MNRDYVDWNSLGHMGVMSLDEANAEAEERSMQDLRRRLKDKIASRTLSPGDKEVLQYVIDNI